ncbi:MULTISPECIES: DUF1540 domain-containing protein [Bacillus]|uniref:Disulfide formation protein C n=1 Tax=Bacillus pseudomycoides TaxID=64104 RepID=A0A1Y3MFA8_9BACI|nr:DUF1540 domain-containing protein [Bacillus pseudomycoides]MDF2083707.1 DUF1540 domain-containing protein [Bacillus pseudomycoides]OUM49115.1 disulfide formation protein C [Bacillus pseudomycoides]
MPEVRCSVSNCSFWGQGNFCQANSIFVQPDDQNTNQSNESYTNSALTDETLESSASTSVETCCQTFRPKY